MVLRLAAFLAAVGQADAVAGRQAQVEAQVQQQAVAVQRRALDAEGAAAA